MNPSDQISVHLFRHGGEDFRKLLEKADVKYVIREHKSGVVMNAGDTIELIKLVGGLSILPSIAAVIVQWLKNKTSRKIMIQTKDNLVVQIEGIEVDEEKLVHLLEIGVSVTAIQPEPDDADNSSTKHEV